MEKKELKRGGEADAWRRVWNHGLNAACTRTWAAASGTVPGDNRTRSVDRINMWPATALFIFQGFQGTVPTVYGTL